MLSIESCNCLEIQAKAVSKSYYIIFPVYLALEKSELGYP